MGIALMLNPAFCTRTTEMSIYHPDYLPLCRFSISSHPHLNQDLSFEDLTLNKHFSEYGTRFPFRYSSDEGEHSHGTEETRR